MTDAKHNKLNNIWWLVGSILGRDDFYPTPDSGQVRPRHKLCFLSSKIPKHTGKKAQNFILFRIMP